MYRGATEEFTLTFTLDADISLIESYCLAFGKSENKSLVEVYEERNEDGVFERASITEVGTSKTLKVMITEEESLKLKVGEIFVQLKISVMGKVLVSNQSSFEVFPSLCSSEMEEHE